MMILIRMISAHMHSTLAFATAILVVEDRQTHGRRFLDCSRARLSTIGPTDQSKVLVT